MSKTDKTLREMLNQFETIVDWFDGDDLDIEAATKKFEEGSKLAEEIKQQLADAKNQIEIVQRKFDESVDPETDQDEM